MKVQCRIAPSLGAGFEGTPETAWGTIPYTDPNAPAVFWGLYGLPDFYALWRHKSEDLEGNIIPRYVLWCGSDVVHFKKGYWLDNEGLIRLDPKPLAKWLNNCHNYVENDWEDDELSKFGIDCKRVPSFMGNVNDYEVAYKPSQTPHVYLSTDKDRQREYGWGTIERIAPHVPEVTFHLYGDSWLTKHKNVIVHGRVPKETMNTEIKEMQAGLRLNRTDGFSEITAKSVLWGQYPITFLDYPLIDSYRNDEQIITLLKELKDQKQPNLRGREYYQDNFNQFPWRQP